MVESVTVSMAQNGKTDEEQQDHDSKMAQVAEESATTLSAKDSRTGLDVSLEQSEPEGADAVTPRPESIPEKFWDAEKGEVNVEALLKSQQDGEAALRAKTQEPKAEGEAEEPAGDGTAYDNAVAKASAEFAEKGELGDSTFEALEKVGLSRDMVNDYIEGQQAIVSTLQNAAYSEFSGNAENFKQASAWAVDNLSEEEIAAIDVQLTSRNPGIVKQGAAALAAKYSANADITPATTVTGQGNASGSGVGFKSGAEMQRAMSDPRYKTDPAFRAEVSSKIMAAERSGVDLFS